MEQTDAYRPISLSDLAVAAKTRRSPLYIWMLENHDAFAAVVAEAVRPDWKELAKAFAIQGLNDAGNKPPPMKFAGKFGGGFGRWLRPDGRSQLP